MNVASVAPMVAVTLELGTSALVTWQAWTIAALAASLVAALESCSAA